MTTPRPFNPARSVIGRIVSRVGMLVLLAATTGCESEPVAPPESYRVRAQVRHVPAADATRGEILVRHEALPSFKNADGEVVGMDTMSMSFPLDDIGLTAGIEVGDKIEMEFEVSWHGGNPLRVTAIDKLPEGTRLAFEPDATETDATETDATEPAPEAAAPEETDTEETGTS